MKLYSYQHDRALAPTEVMNALGWQVGGWRPTYASISPRQLTDLLGESAAVQSMAVATWAFLIACSHALPDLWSGQDTMGAEDQKMARRGTRLRGQGGRVDECPLQT